MSRITVSVGMILLVGCSVVPTLAQDQANEITCSSGTACRVGRIAKYATNGGSSTVNNSNISQGAAGKIGIGTTTPTTNLHIVGGANTGLRVESSVANGNPAITVQANTPAGAASVAINRADGGAPASLFLGTAATLEWAVEIPVLDTEQLNISNASRSPLVTFLQTGQMGIGTQTPANTLEVVAGGTTLADAWTTRSSRQFKTNIQPLEDALQKVEQLQGVSYDRKTDGKHEIGVVAEDVDQVVPEVVSHDPKTHEAQGVDYSRLAALLIEAVKTQQSEIDQLKAQIQKLTP